MPANKPSTLITGRHHPLIKRVRGMVRSGELISDGPAGPEVLLETPRLIENALRSGVPIRTVLVRENATASIRKLAASLPVESVSYVVSAKLLSELSSTESNPGILALARAPSWTESSVFAAPQPLIVVMAGIQDPGNLGTILRAAEAFGATGVLAAKGTAGPFNAKAIRAAAGTLFRLPALWGLPVATVLSKLREHRVTLLSSVRSGGRGLSEMNLSGPLALALGSEGSGLPLEMENAGVRVTIPMAEQVESLNVAAAAAILFYEIARQRQSGNGKGV